MKNNNNPTPKHGRNRTGVGYFWWEAIQNIFSHGFMSFAAVSIILACLLITGSTALISYNIGINIQELEQSSEIVLFIDESLPSEEAKALQRDLLAISNISTAEFQPREKALEDWRDQLGEDASLLEGFDASNNPLRDGFHITMKDLSQAPQTVEEIKKIPGIAKVSDNQETLAKLVKVEKVVSIVSWALVAALGAISIFIISNTVKLAMFTRRQEIAIEKMVGATNWFIRWPFVIEGMLLGLTAGGLATLAEWGVYSKLVNVVGVLESFKMAQFQDIGILVLAVFLGAGVVIGIGGSVLSMRRFLDV